MLTLAVDVAYHSFMRILLINKLCKLSTAKSTQAFETLNERLHQNDTIVQHSNYWGTQHKLKIMLPRKTK